MKEKNYTIIGVISIILIISGAIINLIVHELSHYLVLKICNGSFVDGKIASESFVAGYIEPQYIAVVALASIYIPLFISLIMSAVMLCSCFLYINFWLPLQELFLNKDFFCP